ncbi:MAG: restriction endonuclease [Verrucomicrobiaceae bacterium]|nr:MAG: restriction endonuclease [Verrucomicrobiaceae bacterium]
MIRRTVLEWQSLRHGEAEDCIPDWAADRLSAVAKSSPLGGKEGARVLEQGRRQLRAQQVVGVIAAEGCSLEILPKIDFEGEVEGGASIAQTRKQLVHMLAVALDMEIASGAVTDLGWQRENLLEILIGLFSRKLADAVRQGMPKRYLAHEEDLPALRGKLDVVPQFTRLAASPDRLACRFDALSYDFVLNQIMKAAVMQLLRISRSEQNLRRLRELALVYADISDQPVAQLQWDAVILDRTNVRWRELINLAKLLLGERFQTTSSGVGRGFSLLFEMNTLFEEYIARTLRRALSGTDFKVHAQGGGLFCLQHVQSGALRFKTAPDILVRRNGQVVMVIDTKWKRLSTQIDDKKRGVAQSDIYQMMAYGRVYGCAELMLLYPHHRGLDRPEGKLDVHRVRGGNDMLTTATVDVSTRVEMLNRIHALVAPVCQREPSG